MAGRKKQEIFVDASKGKKRTIRDSSNPRGGVQKTKAQKILMAIKDLKEKRKVNIVGVKKK